MNAQQIFLVAQGGRGDTRVYLIERDGKFLWAPKTNELGHIRHHWTNLLHVKKGDLILHYASGEFKAVSQALTNCFDADMPKDLPNYWENIGRRVNCCEYVEFIYPLKRDIFRHVIMENKNSASANYYERYGRYNEFHSAFTRNGTVNQGYLFHLQEEIFDAVIHAALAQQPGLERINFIAEYLNR